MRIIIGIIVLAHLISYSFVAGGPRGQVEATRQREIDERMERYRKNPVYQEMHGEQSPILAEEQETYE